MKLLLITGAGASRELAFEGDHMPLMPDWSEKLCDALDEREPNLAEACRLSRNASGPEFEANLGMLLQWRRALPLAERFKDLGGPHAGSSYAPQNESLENTKRRLTTVVDVLNATLYDEFGLQRVDDNRAHDAYAALLNELRKPDLVVATTNYDRTAERALRLFGHEVTTGFSGEPERTPILHAAGMIRDKGSTTPVLYLHGAVGWYERAGTVEDHYGDRGFNASLGSPVVLYPDPDKDPAGDAIVSQLWAELRQAVAWCDQILVIGHSLNDRALVDALESGILSDKRLAVTYIDEEGRRAIESRFPDEAAPIHMKFGPEPEWDDAELYRWAGFEVTRAQLERQTEDRQSRAV